MTFFHEVYFHEEELKGTLYKKYTLYDSEKRTTIEMYQRDILKQLYEEEGKGFFSTDQRTLFLVKKFIRLRDFIFGKKIYRSS